MYIVRKDYLVTVKIDFPGLDPDAWVLFREMDYMTTISLKQVIALGDEKKIVEFLLTTMPAIILDHSFYVSEIEKMKNEDVVKMLFEKTETANKLIEDFVAKAFFTGAKKSEV